MASAKKRKRGGTASHIPEPHSVERTRIWQKQQDLTLSESRPFPLLKLPPELRNLVYEKVLEDDGTVHVLRRNPSVKSKVTVTCQIAFTNKQVRAEFTNIALVVAPIIKTQVVNYNFEHLITFLNRLNDHELNRTVAQDERCAERRMLIYLSWCTSRGPAKLHFKESRNFRNLRRWLNRLDNPAKRGSNIQFNYQCASSPGTLIPWPDRDVSPKVVAELGKMAAAWRLTHQDEEQTL